MSNPIRQLAIFCTLVFLPGAIGAQVPRAPLSSVSFYEENDVLTGTDHHYTQGLKLSFFRVEEGTPDWLSSLADTLWPILADNNIFFSKNAGWALGQNIYTGEDIRRASIDPDDRPWAGWLYVGRLLQITDLCSEADKTCRQQQHTFELDLGVVGPASGAEWAQTWLHKRIESPEPMGWGNQLGDEPGLLLLYKGKWRFLASRTFDVVPHGGIALGNVLTYLSTGGTARVGFNLTGFPTDSIPAAARENRPQWEAYAFGGVDGRLTAVNIFLDGNHFRDSYSIDKEAFVYDLSYGGAIRYKQLRLTYTIVRRSPEFEPRSRRDLDPQNFGSFVLSWER
jgi:lipid A 3-O-deacylase